MKLSAKGVSLRERREGAGSVLDQAQELGMIATASQCPPGEAKPDDRQVEREPAADGADRILAGEASRDEGDHEQAEDRDGPLEEFACGRACTVRTEASEGAADLETELSVALAQRPVNAGRGVVWLAGAEQDAKVVAVADELELLICADAPDGVGSDDRIETMQQLLR
jgi:hypothetical protein